MSPEYVLAGAASSAWEGSAIHNITIRTTDKVSPILFISTPPFSLKEFNFDAILTFLVLPMPLYSIACLSDCSVKSNALPSRFTYFTYSILT
jgi:hypothetical protein